MKVKIISRWRVFFLVSILALAAFLRLYRLGNYPPLNADEAAIGYNAWSLLKTGRDEHGEAWPLHFKSFGDYKPGGYFYLVLPFIKWLGLNEWAVRLPSALLGIASIYLVYALACLLWQDEDLGLIWAFVLAVSPWHLHFSRGGWESNAALFFLILGVYLFFISLRPKNKFSFSPFQFSLLAFLAAMYTYHSARIVAPALIIGLFFNQRRYLWRQRIRLIFPLFITAVLLFPLGLSFFHGGAAARFSGVGLLADSGPVWRANELLSQHRQKTWPHLFHNRPLLYGLAFLQKYAAHFSGNFLFIDGDKVPRSKVPDMGVMHIFEVWLLGLGIWGWLRARRRYLSLPWWWLLAAPLASALTFQAPSALRALPLVVPLTFFVAYGVEMILKSFPRVGGLGRIKWITLALIMISYFWGIANWSNQYFVYYLKRYPTAWPNFKPLAQQLGKNQAKINKICLSGNYDQPYILTLFYLKYPPQKAQKEIKLTPADKFGFSTVRHFGRYWFGHCEMLKDAKIIRE